jgi:hypothetical protein
MQSDREVEMDRGTTERQIDNKNKDDREKERCRQTDTQRQR